MSENTKKRLAEEDLAPAAIDGDENGSSNKKGKTTAGLDVEKTIPAAVEDDDLVGLAFAKAFDNDSIYFGIIVDKFYDVKDEEWCWTVVYEDGDSEDYPFEEVQKGMALYVEKLAGKGSLGSNENSEPMISNHAYKFFEFVSKRQKAFEHWKAKRNATLNGDIGGIGADENEDPILKEYHFCNVYRELDRGTTFFHSHILDEWKAFVDKYPTDEERQSHLVDWIRTVLWNSFVYRQVNKVESFFMTGKKKSVDGEDEDGDDEEHESSSAFAGGIPSPHDWPKFKEEVRKIQDTGGKKAFFTDAHLNQGFDRFISYTDRVLATKQTRKHTTVDDGGEPPRTTLDSTAQAIHDEGIVVPGNNLESSFNLLKKLPGVGDFMSWQILCDLMESNCLPTCNIEDFCGFGPGARGMYNICCLVFTRNSRFVVCTVRC